MRRGGEDVRLTGMRGDERIQDRMFSYVSLEQRVPADPPLRAVRKLADAVLRSLSPEFDALYAASGRPSIAPEYILRALLLQVSTRCARSDCRSGKSTTSCCFAVRWLGYGRCGLEPRRVLQRTAT